MSTATHIMVTVECACRICKINAAKIGKSLPLRAECTEAMAAHATKHQIVELANHPVLGTHMALIRAL